MKAVARTRPTPIRRLPDELVREIAAGEVINRPADVLKELLENALDAGAQRIEVLLDGGGAERLVVRDNGVGIAFEQLELALDAHSTSKLEQLDAITTLGFRGEGLHAIRCAATLRLSSRPVDQLGGGTVTAQGDDLSLREAPAPAGTEVEVTELFARLPARRRALRSPEQEGRACLALLGRYLLHHPQLQLKVTVDGEERWRYAGGSHLDAARFLWGPVTANRLLPLDATPADGLRLQGLFSRPELLRARRDRLHLAVNGRPVEWPAALLAVILEAYRELLPGGRFPVGVLDLTLPPETVLVNTAPDKRTVRLLDEEAVADAVREALAELLGSHPLAPPLPLPSPAQGVGAAPRAALPRLQHLGRFRDLYLLAEADGQLWVVDQHAAHERILYEELCRRFADEPPLELATPELLELSPEEAENYRARHDALAARGLELEPFGPNRWRVRRVPAFLAGYPQLVAEVVRGSLGDHDLDAAWRAVLGRLACLPAIKAGHPLAHADAQALLDALRACETPWACPHGRPTALVLSELELARRFGRRGPRAVAVEQEV